MNKFASERGFTLLEILIVLTIIGILVAIAIVSYHSVISAADKTSCLANQRTIEAARTYNMNKNGNYGNSIADLEEVFDLIGFLGYASEEDLVCPSGGVYEYKPNSPEISCSIAGHI